MLIKTNQNIEMIKHCCHSKSPKLVLKSPVLLCIVHFSFCPSQISRKGKQLSPKPPAVLLCNCNFMCNIKKIVQVSYVTNETGGGGGGVIFLKTLENDNTPHLQETDKIIQTGRLKNSCVTRLVCWWAWSCLSAPASNFHRWLASCVQHREKESIVHQSLPAST